MKVAIAKVFRMSKSDLQRYCLDLIYRSGCALKGADPEDVVDRLGDCIGSDLARLFPDLMCFKYSSVDERDLHLREIGKQLTDEDIRLILKHLGGRMIYDSLKGDFTEESFAKTFDDCNEETFVQFLK